MSSYSGEAAEQVVRMSLEGTETVLKLTGSAAKHLAIMLYAVIKDQEKSSGQTRLANMLKSGKELKIFAIKDENLETFHKEAKHYGILYTTIKNRTVDDGNTDIMIKAEDAAIVNRLFERLKLMTADKARSGRRSRSLLRKSLLLSLTGKTLAHSSMPRCLTLKRKRQTKTLHRT